MRLGIQALLYFRNLMRLVLWQPHLREFHVELILWILTWAPASILSGKQFNFYFLFRIFHLSFLIVMRMLVPSTRRVHLLRGIRTARIIYRPEAITCRIFCPRRMNVYRKRFYDPRMSRARHEWLISEVFCFCISREEECISEWYLYRSLYRNAWDTSCPNTGAYWYHRISE